jgi:hypothetical protein
MSAKSSGPCSPCHTWHETIGQDTLSGVLESYDHSNQAQDKPVWVKSTAAWRRCIRHLQPDAVEVGRPKRIDAAAWIATRIAAAGADG